MLVPLQNLGITIVVMKYINFLMYTMNYIITVKLYNVAIVQSFDGGKFDEWMLLNHQNFALKNFYIIYFMIIIY